MLKLKLSKRSLRWIIPLVAMLVIAVALALTPALTMHAATVSPDFFYRP